MGRNLILVVFLGLLAEQVVVSVLSLHSSDLECAQAHRSKGTRAMSSSGAMNHTAVLGSSLHGGMLVVRLRVPQTMRDEFPDFDVLPLKEAKKIVEALERERDRSGRGIAARAWWQGERGEVARDGLRGSGR